MKRMVETKAVALIESMAAKNVTPEMILAPKIESLVDSDGNRRFIEGDNVTSGIPAGVNIVYNKWSLSGTHLMIVVAGNIANGTEFAGTKAALAKAKLPEYILDKIVPVWANKNIDAGTIQCRAADWSTQQINVAIEKDGEYVTIYTSDSRTFNADRSFRFQFDLLIDSSPTE